MAVLATALAGAFLTPLPATAATLEAEAPDFATDVYGDPWDFSNTADVNTDEVASKAQVSSGGLRVRIAPSDGVSIVSTVSGSLPYGRDGATKPVDPTKYTHLSFSLDQPLDRHIGAVYWFTCRERSAACGGGITFPVTPGKHTYDFDLRKSSTLLGKVPWRSTKIVSFRVDPVVVAGGDAGIGKTAVFSWMRLHAAPDASRPHAALPPGKYDGFTISRRPQLVVDSPNPSEGRALEVAQGRSAWTFTSAARARGISTENARILAYDSRGMTGRNAGPAQNDPRLHLPVKPFSGSTYHRLEFEMTYDGPYSLSGAPGGGKLARLIWTASGSGTPQIGNDIVTYSGGNAGKVSIDLTAADPLDEDALAPELGWKGRTITSLRFDPNEDPGAAVWHLESVHLRADPASNTRKTTVRFHDAGWVSGTTATVAVGKGAPGTSGYRTIASGVAVEKGANAVPFALGSLPTGRYHVRVTLRHPNGTSVTSYAPAPVVMR
ncbi:hypothetical protein DEJ23_09805 [Curtobacterium sp. MCSS17_008]|nr:hypothetical protein DEJ23_09805 [Curtobacterium sp. MCSS17_008]